MISKKYALVPFAAAVTAPVYAAVPESVTTAITEAVTDVGTIGAAILGLMVAIAAFFWLRRPIK